MTTTVIIDPLRRGDERSETDVLVRPCGIERFVDDGAVVRIEIDTRSRTVGERVGHMQSAPHLRNRLSFESRRVPDLSGRHLRLMRLSGAAALYIPGRTDQCGTSDHRRTDLYPILGTQRDRHRAPVCIFLIIIHVGIFIRHIHAHAHYCHRI